MGNEVTPPNLRDGLMMHHLKDGVIPQTKHPINRYSASFNSLYHAAYPSLRKVFP